MLSFLKSPLALWFLALIPPIVLLYLLKMKRQRTLVSSTMLWERVVSDLQANTPFQKLRANLQLFLQLLLVIALTLALAGLFYKGADDGGRTVVAIVDASASMQARDGTPTRFEQARARLAQLVSTMNPTDEMMILVASSQGVSAQLDFSDRPSELRAFVQAMQPTDGSRGVREALLAAAGALRGRLYERGDRKPEILLLSDGGVGQLGELQDLDYPVRYVPCGRRDDNVAITALRVRRLPGGGGRHAVFCEVTNFGSAPWSGFVSLGEGVRGGEISSQKLTLAPRTAQGQTFDLRIAPGPINVQIDADDALALDNRCIGFIPEPARVVVGMSGTLSPFIARALAMDELVEPVPYRSGLRADLVIAERAMPSPPPRCPVVLIAPQALPAGVVSKGKLEDIRISDWSRTHPLMRYLELSDVAIYKATSLGGERTLPLVRAGDHAIVCAHARGRHQDVIIGFDLKHSNWPLRASFPIFLFNLVERAREARRAVSPRTLRPGQTLPIEISSGGKVEVTPPDGRPIELPGPGNPRYFHQTEKVGLYQVRAGTARYPFAVNLLDPDESDIKPLAQLELGSSEVVEDEVRMVDKPLWRLLALLALLLGLAEWWVFHRKIA